MIFIIWLWNQYAIYRMDEIRHKFQLVILKKEETKMSRRKIVSIEDRIPQLKKSRKKKANRRLVFYLTIFFLLISIIVYLQSPLSNVKHIIINGNSFVMEDEIVELSELTEKTNIWAIDQKEITEGILDHPVIESVDVRRKLPSTIEIQISEHDLVGYIKEGDKIHPILGTGITLPVDVESLSNAPQMVGFTEESYLKNMTTELEKLPKSIRNLISEIHWQPTEENKNKILLYMNDGYVVDGTIKKFSDKMQVYPSIVSQLDPDMKGIIHIGVGAYFEEFKDKSKNDQKENESES